jgi:hypothetical protein
MARMYGGASQYLKKIEKIDLIAAITYLVILAFICYAVFVKNFRYLFSLGGLIGIVISFGPLAWFAYYRYRKHIIDSGKFHRGRKGEGAIWYKLIKLSEEYSIFQDVKIGDSVGNIDFVVVGPGGVYALEVKSHSGKIDFNGAELTRNGKLFEKDFLNQAKSEALQIHDFIKTKAGLDIFVKPVLVFSGYVRMHFGLKPIAGVYVIGKAFLHEFFNKEPIATFSKSKVEEALKELSVKT